MKPVVIELPDCVMELLTEFKGFLIPLAIPARGASFTHWASAKKNGEIGEPRDKINHGRES